MRLLTVSAILCACIVSSGAVAAESKSVAGKTFQYTNGRGQTYWTTYKKNGTTFTKSTRSDGSGFIYDTGRWRMEQGAICERYTNWQRGREFCHEPGAQANSQGKAERRSDDTCSNQNRECTDFCKTPAGIAQGQACARACSGRMRTCLKTGTYAWRNKPNVTGLQRR
jgi:hypothetical protein